MGGQKQIPQSHVEFHLFERLPVEIRLMIWRLNWEPRTVTLFPTDDGLFIRRREEDKEWLPVTGYINREARAETLRYYQRISAYMDGSNLGWFNFRLDTLCLAGGPLSLPYLNPATLRQVQRLIIPEIHPGRIHAAVPCNDSWPVPVTESIESPVIKELLAARFPSLREVTLTTHRWRVFTVEQESHPYYCHVHRFVQAVSQVGGFGHMRTTYVAGLKVRHSPTGRQTYQQRYCCRLSGADIMTLLTGLYYTLKR